MHIFLRAPLWLNSHFLPQAHLSFLFLHKIPTVGTIPMRLSCWKHHCLNQQQEGKIQTQTFKECEEKSNPVRANISSQVPPPRICRERKAEVTSQQYTFFSSPVISLVLLSYSIAFGGTGHNRGALHTSLWYGHPWTLLLRQPLSCNSSIWNLDDAHDHPRLHKQSRTDMEKNMDHPNASPLLLWYCYICDAHPWCRKHSWPQDLPRIHDITVIMI